jgi:hypothetical protein
MGFWTSDCDPFDLTVDGDLQAALDRARSQITSGGGSFSGDSASGSFSGPTPVGSVEGTYTVNGNVVTIKITSRPRIASCGTIEERIRGFFA